MKSALRILLSNASIRVLGCVLVAGLIMLSGGRARLTAQQQPFSSGSDGSDGVYAPTGTPGTIIMFDPSQFHGSQVAANIFNFVSVTIPTGVTIKFSESVISGPVIWLSQADVVIQGSLDLSGGKGTDPTSSPFQRVASVAGPGGFPGGLGGFGAQTATSGGGPSGGSVSGCTNCNASGNAGSYGGDTFLIPLIGGSGGAGAALGGQFGGGGGAGGGAILIASSTTISMANGTINVRGGAGGVNPGGCGTCAGGGSGGAIRLIANTISGTGTLTALGGGGGNSFSGGTGVIRLESYSSTTFSGTAQLLSSPFPLLLNTVGPATAKVMSVNGVAVNPNSNTFPDITINTTSPVPVVVQTHNVPSTATIKLTVIDQNGVADTVFQAPVGTCDQSNTCTTTINVVFPFGASRGLTKVTWTQ